MFNDLYVFITGFSFAVAIFGVITLLIYIIVKEKRIITSFESNLKGNKEKLLPSKRLFKVALFVLLLIAISPLIIIWINNAGKQIGTNYKAKFTDVGVLGKGSRVIYRGVDVGEVTDITISPDSEYAVVNFRLIQNKFYIYEGSVAEIAFRSITGTQALVIRPPSIIKGKKPISEGGILVGYNSFTTVDQMQRLVSRLVEEGKIETMINNASDLLINSKHLTSELVKLNRENQANFKVFLVSYTSLSSSLKATTDNINNIMSDKKTINNLRSSIASTDETMKDLKKMVNKTDTMLDKSVKAMESFDKSMTNLDDTLNDPELKSTLKQSLGDMSTVMIDIKTITGDKEVMDSMKKSIIESTPGITSFNCLSKEMTNTLSKPFLIPRMILGNPAKNLKKCYPY